MTEQPCSYGVVSSADETQMIAENTFPNEMFSRMGAALKTVTSYSASGLLMSTKLCGGTR